VLNEYVAARECVTCGCSDDNACLTSSGACSWASLTPPVCSECAAGRNAEPSLGERVIYGPNGETLSIVPPEHGAFA
jgi:hypothetical protein